MASTPHRLIALGAFAVMVGAGTGRAWSQDWGIEVRDAPGAAGVQVAAVRAASPAQAAGIEPGDRLLRVQGTAVANVDQYRAALAALGTQEVTLRVSRNGWERELRLPALAVERPFGVALRARSTGPGAAIVSVEPGSAAASAGLRSGDVVLRVGAEDITDVGRLQRRLGDLAREARPVVIVVERSNWRTQLTLMPTTSTAAAGRAIDGAGPSDAGRADPVADVTTANRFYEAGNWGEAERYYKRVLGTLPDESRSWGRLCHAQVMQERFGDAAATCQSAVKNAPGEASIYQNVGYSLFRLGRPGEAIAWYQKTIELAPEGAHAHAGLGAAQIALREWAAAERSFRAALARDPGSQSGWQSLGDVAGELGKPAEAVAHYRKALQLGPPNVELYRGLGWQHYREGRLAEAETALREANRLGPKDVNTLVTLGMVAEKLGRIAEAREAWQRAVQLDPDGALGAIARRNLGIVAAKPALRTDPVAPSGDPKAGPAVVPDEPRPITESESESGI